MRHCFSFFRTLVVASALLVLLSGCALRPRTLPEGGFDYRLSDGILLGYPIPRSGSNPYLLNPGETSAAFSYSEQDDTYLELPVESVRVRIGESLADLRCVSSGGATVFFSAAETDLSGSPIRVSEGSVLGRAVVMRGASLYLCSRSDSICLTDSAETVWDCYENTVLFSQRDGSAASLCLFAGDETTPRAVAAAESVSSAWIARSGSSLCVVFTADGVRYLADPDGTVQPALSPPGENGFPNEDGAEYFTATVRGTEYAVFGNLDDLWFFRLRDGYVIPVNMGGLYDVEGGGPTAEFPLAPDRLSAYFEDLECVYRLNLATSELSLAQNWAPIFENTCTISSMTAVTDTRILLSQASAEHTEFEAVITETLFEDETPDTREKETKIDAD